MEGSFYSFARPDDQTEANTSRPGLRLYLSKEKRFRTFLCLVLQLPESRSSASRVPDEVLQHGSL